MGVADLKDTVNTEPPSQIIDAPVEVRDGLGEARLPQQLRGVLDAAARLAELLRRADYADGARRGEGCGYRGASVCPQPPQAACASSRAPRAASRPYPRCDLT